MKKIILLCCSLLCLHVLNAQERPPGYAVSVLSRYDYRGWLIKKGDRLHLRDGDVLTVKEILKYNVSYIPTYYVKGKNKAGKEVWYPIANAVAKGDLIPPGDITLIDKPAFGSLPAVNGKIMYEYIGEVADAPQDKLFDRVLTEFTKSIATSSEPLQVQISDKEEGHIMAQAGFALSYGRLLDLNGLKEMRVTYVCDVRVKDGRYKINLSSFNQEMCSVTGKWDCYPVYMGIISNSGQQRDKDVTEAFDNHNKRWLQNFALALNAVPDDNW